MKKIALRGKNGLDKFALVDDCDYKMVDRFKWCLNPLGYASRSTYDRITKDRGHALMHRLIMGFPYGNVDHINRNRLDNRKSNLRTVSQSINCFNSSTRVKTSKYRGVFKHSQSSPRDKLWVAQINVNKKRKSIGYFRTEIEAAKAYNSRAKKEYGELATLNIIIA